MSARLLLSLVVSAAVLVPVAASAQAAAPPEGPGIWIGDARGNLRPVPPVAASFLRQESAGRVVFAVDAFAETASGALSAARLAATRVGSAVAGLGGSSGGVTTEVGFVEPRYQHRILMARWEKPRRLGFDAAYLVSVPTSESARLGLLIDLAMGAGATRVLEVVPAGPQAQP